MSEQTMSNPPGVSILIEAMENRRSLASVRIALAVVLAGVFFPNTGLAFALVWFATYVALQGLEFFVLTGERLRRWANSRRGRTGILAVVTLSNIAFALFGAREAMGGEPAALACASLLIGGASFNAVLTSHQCRPLLWSALVPAMVLNLTVPVGAWLSGSSLLHSGLLLGGVMMYYLFVFQALKLVNRMFDAERKAREAAEAAEAARARMVANVSHELRTPLNAVVASASLLRLSDLDARGAEAVGHLTSGAATLQALISDILDASKAEAGRMDLLSDPFNIVAAARATSELFRASAESKGLSFSFQSDVDEAWILGDAMRFGQILANLCNNAIKFTAAGEIAVTLMVAVDQDQTRVDLAVRDTGIGMDADTASRMFAPFVQADASTARRFGGTGLGLSISKALSQAMGGDLWVESAMGEGSSFRLRATLPTAEPVVVHETVVTQSQDWIQERPHVLVADDNLANRRLITLILQDHCEVTTVEDGAQALALMETHAFDLFITDLQMPVMDGPTALAHLRRSEAGSPHRMRALLATADAQIALAAAEAMGADGVLTKPFTATELLDSVSAQLRQTVTRQAA